MEVKLQTLIPFERIQEAPGEVFDLVDQYGQAVLLKNNTPVYIIMKPQAAEASRRQADASPKPSVHTLHEAMQIVLMDAEDHQMHAAKLADIIYERGLYVQRNGGKAKYNQLRARCGHYPDMFEALQGNTIRLKT